MRKYSILSLAMSLALLTALSAGAQTSSSSSSTSTTSSSTAADSASSKSTTSSSTKYHRANGDITAIDTAAQTLTIKHGKDTWTFKTDNATKVKGLGKTIAFADLQVGDNIRVSYTQSGDDKTAARIDVLHGKKS